MELGLSGKKVLVTGASMGIGEAIARSFAEEGARVHLAARSAGSLKSLAAALERDFGAEIKVHPCDLSSSGASEKLAAEVGDVDILVNNAGAIPFGTLEAIDEAKWRDAWDLKVFGYINLSRCYYRQMSRSGQGTIILIAGLAGEKPNADYIAGSSGNAALMAFGRALGGRSLDKGVRVLTINPGSILTERILVFFRHQASRRFNDESRWEEVMRDMKLPGGRCGSPKELADVAVFMASSRASYVSGTVITVDGGLSAAT